MSDERIPPEIVAKYESIKLIKNKARKRHLIYYLIFSVVVIILYLIKFPMTPFLPLVTGSLLILISTLDSLKGHDLLFIKLYKSIEMLKLADTNSSFLNDAYKNFNDAMGYITSPSEYTFPWYSKIEDSTNKFISNLKDIISPAILEGHISYEDLILVAYIFMKAEINDINRFNKDVNERLGNILFISHERDKTIKDITISFMTSIYSSVIIKFILSISGGYSTAFLLSYIFLKAGHQIEPDSIYAGAIALTIFFAHVVSLTKEKIFRIRDDNGWPLKWTKKR